MTHRPARQQQGRPAGVFIFGHDRRFIWASTEALEHIGYTMEELASMTPADIKPDMDEAALGAVLDNVSHGIRGRLLTRHQRKTGELVPVSVRISVCDAGYMAVVSEETDWQDTPMGAMALIAEQRRAIEASPGGKRPAHDDLIRRIASTLEEEIDAYLEGKGGVDLNLAHLAAFCQWYLGDPAPRADVLPFQPRQSAT